MSRAGEVETFIFAPDIAVSADSTGNWILEVGCGET